MSLPSALQALCCCMLSRQEHTVHLICFTHCALQSTNDIGLQVQQACPYSWLGLIRACQVLSEPVRVSHWMICIATDQRVDKLLRSGWCLTASSQHLVTTLLSSLFYATIPLFSKDTNTMKTMRSLPNRITCICRSQWFDITRLITQSSYACIFSESCWGCCNLKSTLD